MDAKLLEIAEHNDPGYKALIAFAGWRVAFLNDDPSRFRRETMPYLERHNETDEVFVLTKGNCTLYIGDGRGDTPGHIETVKMEPNRMYNVKQGVWHNLVGDEDMVLLIVENADTSKANSDFFPVTEQMLP